MPLAAPTSPTTGTDGASGGVIAAVKAGWARYDGALKTRWPRGRWVVHGITGLLVLSLVAAPFSGRSRSAGASADPSPTATVAADVLRIITPSDGATVETASLTIAGTAPVGAVITRDVDQGFDEHVTASDGTWTMVIELDEGANAIVLRLGDEASTAQTLHVTYRSSASVSTQAAVPESTATATQEPSETPEATAEPTPEPTSEPTPNPTAEPTPEPTEEPTPEPTFATFEDGTWEVGADIAPGTYRVRDLTGFCYWARLSGFGGSLDDIIANQNVLGGYAIVTIGKNDAGFESTGCGEWTKDLSQVTDSRSAIDFDGTYIVGTDIKPGKWRATGGEYCYWARLKGFGGTLGSIIANDNVLGGRTIVTIKSTDKGFETRGCGTWSRD